MVDVYTYMSTYTGIQLHRYTHTSTQTDIGTGTHRVYFYLFLWYSLFSSVLHDIHTTAADTQQHQ